MGLVAKSSIASSAANFSVLTGRNKKKPPKKSLERSPQRRR